MSQPTRYGAFIALLPGLQQQGTLMPSVVAAISLTRVAPKLIASNSFEQAVGDMARDGSLEPTIDNLALLAKSLAGLMADPAQVPLVMSFLRAFDTES